MSQDDTPQQLVRIFPDQPVTGAEGLDFQFDALARTLAELAWNPDNATPFTVVIRGGWGRGKTTLLRQTERLLREDKTGQGRREVRPLWFTVAASRNTNPRGRPPRKSTPFRSGLCGNRG